MAAAADGPPPAPAPPKPAPRTGAPLTLEQWALRKRLAAIWLFIIVVTHIIYIAFAAFVLPKPPRSMGLYWPTWAEGGLTMRELGGLLAVATAMCAALTAVQEAARLVMDEKLRGEKIFFVSSVGTRFFFLGVLAYHHYGPGGWDKAVDGSSGYRMLLMASFFAGYTSDILQLAWRPQEFAKSFRTFMMAHHILSFAWFTPWLITIAPRVVEGEAIWKTVFVYLCAAVPNHTYKLVGCWYKPAWYQHLLAPAILGHWAVLIASQGYFWNQCMCSAWGCWYPASVIMLFGAWGMAFYDVPTFFDVMVAYYTKLYGVQFGLWEIAPILFRNAGRPAPAAAPAPAPAAPAPAAAPAAAAETSRVEVELVLRGGGKGGKGQASRGADARRRSAAAVAAPAGSP